MVHVGKLARLELSEADIEHLTAELGAMLDHFADIDELQLDDVVPMTQPYPLTNVMRDDTVWQTLSADEALANAPETAQHFFVVPRIVE